MREMLSLYKTLKNTKHLLTPCNLIKHYTMFNFKNNNNLQMYWFSRVAD